MKKSALFLFISVLQFGYSQTFQIGKKNPSQKDITEIFCNESIWISSYVDHMEGNWKTTGYEVVELESTNRRLSGPIDRRYENLIGNPLSFFEQDGYLFELSIFHKMTGLTKKCSLGLIKRNINDFQQVGQIEWIGEFQLFDLTSVPNLAVYHDLKGITVLSGHQYKGDLKPFISRYDFNLNLLWKKEPEHLADENTHIIHYNGDDEGRGLVVLRTGFGDAKIGG